MGGLVLQSTTTRKELGCLLAKNKEWTQYAVRLAGPASSGSTQGLAWSTL